MSSTMSMDFDLKEGILSPQSVFTLLITFAVIYLIVSLPKCKFPDES